MIYRGPSLQGPAEVIVRPPTKILIITALFVIAFSSACSRGDRIIKVADLPDTPEFQVDARPEFSSPTKVPTIRVHVDVGYVWTQNKLIFFPVLNLEGRYVGYTGNEETFIELKKGELEDWAAKANVSIPEKPSIPFWDAWGGKLALIALTPPFILLSLLADRLWRRVTTGM